MEKINKIQQLNNETIYIGRGFEVVIARRLETYDSPASSGYTEREIRPLFRLLLFRRKVVTDNILDVLDLIEILRGFAGNRMITGKIYHVPHTSPDQPDQPNALVCETRPERGLVYLFIFRGARKTNVLLDKVECSQLAAKTSKIISACAYPDPGPVQDDV
ncbi:MAG: hypothetical protein Q7J15_09090 [Candidatus Desulfaltia sp.]|nr:hypothetical protein [Candidatus Desulfaltia sp.]